MYGICKLCQDNSKLEESHILPKFIYRWIIKTSATGRLRKLGNPNIPVQDGKKLYLLCSNCEDKFSIYETWFANNFFHPSIKNIKINYDYNEYLFKFVTSLFWRTIIVNIDRDIYNQTPLKSNLLKCEEELRNFLLNDIYPINFDQNYIGMTSYVANAPKHLKGLNFYFTRHANSEILFNDTDTKMYFYCVIPYFNFVGNIIGINPLDFTNCLINPIGGHFLTTTMRMKEPSVNSFMQAQLNRIENITLSENQKSIIAEKMLKNPEKYTQTKSFEARFLDFIRES